MDELPKNEGLDLTGLGKVAKAIPKEVYERSTATLLTTFEKLTAPITESTGGLGRYLRQKFDNMVEVEKAIATYTVEKAMHRARERCERAGIPLQPPPHPKTFVTTIEEASKETDPVLHEMWANLLASQLSDVECHPHFVEVLAHFSPAEAKILVSLFPKPHAEDSSGPHVEIQPYSFTHWVRRETAYEPIEPWTISCDMLLEFRFADVLPPKPYRRHVAQMYRTPLGSSFLKAVSPQTSVAVDADQPRLITIDTTSITGQASHDLVFTLDDEDTVFGFLSQIYSYMIPHVLPFTYGTAWILEDASTALLFDANSETERQQWLTMFTSRAGLRSGMKFRAVRITENMRSKAKMPSPS